MSYKDAVTGWDVEVDREAERLVEEGTPPYDALQQAVRNVSERRKQKTSSVFKGMGLSGNTIIPSKDRP